MMKEENAAQPRPSVMLVEDDDAIRRSFQLLLRSRGYDVRAYASPAYAIADKPNRSAACLIADLVMPGVDGLMLLDRLRADGWSGPAILISGYLTREREKQARQAGFDVVLEKPVADSRLVNALVDLLPRNGTNGTAYA